jgi:hypothetical protein
MNDINNIIEHIEIISWWRGWEPICRKNKGIEVDMNEKGNKKGNIWGQTSISQTPPQGWSNRGGGAVAHPSTSPRTP